MDNHLSLDPPHPNEEILKYMASVLNAKSYFLPQTQIGRVLKSRGVSAMEVAKAIKSTISGFCSDTPDIQAIYKAAKYLERYPVFLLLNEDELLELYQSRLKKESE